MQQIARERLAVITGGTSGIGYAVALELGRRGYRLIITGRDPHRGEAAQDRLSQSAGVPAQFLSLAADDWGQYDALVKMAGPGPVDALVISAGEGIEARVLDTGRAAFQHLLDVNVTAALATVQALSPLMGEGSRVALISSDAGVEGEQATGAYSVSKAALNMLGRMLAMDLAERGVCLNIVCPGDTVPGMRHMLKPGAWARDPEAYKTWPLPPRGRWGTAADVAHVVGYLTTEAPDFMVGATILVDGGSRAGRR